MTVALFGLAGTVAVVGIGLASLIMTGQRRTDFAIAELRASIGELRERMAHLEGLLEGLRDSISRNRAA